MQSQHAAESSSVTAPSLSHRRIKCPVLSSRIQLVEHQTKEQIYLRRYGCELHANMGSAWSLCSQAKQLTALWRDALRDIQLFGVQRHACRYNALALKEQNRAVLPGEKCSSDQEEERKQDCWPQSVFAAERSLDSWSKSSGSL